jgi:hypothetical protein
MVIAHPNSPGWSTFERREVDLGKQSPRPDKRHNGGTPVPSLLSPGQQHISPRRT